MITAVSGCVAGGNQMEVDGSIAVFDVWESVEQFEKFGETLVPIMSNLGADPGQPQVSTIRNLPNG
jgi:hypothetical protein